MEQNTLFVSNDTSAPNVINIAKRINTLRKKPVIINSDKELKEIVETALEKSKVIPKPEDYGMKVSAVRMVDGEDKSVDTVVSVEHIASGKKITLNMGDMICNTKIAVRIKKDFANLGCDVSCTEIAQITAAEKYRKGIIDQCQHTELGFGEYNGQTVFKWHSIVSTNDEVSSAYLGKVEIGMLGDRETFEEKVRSLICGNSRLELLLVTGVSGLICQALDLPDTNLLINLTGRTSIGKTVSSQLALVSSGNPTKLMVSFNSTDNSIEETMLNYKTVPFVIDDKLARSRGQTQDQLARELMDYVFRMSTSHLKGRMNSNKSFSKIYCPVITSTEESMVNLLRTAGEKKGQFYRIIEIPCEPGQLTNSSEHAIKINEFCTSNYGIAMEYFSKWFMQNNLYGNELYRLYNDFRRQMTTEFRSVDGTGRMANRAAIIILSAKLFEDCFKLGIGLDGIKTLLLDSAEASFAKRDQSEVCYDRVQEYVLKHPSVFAKSRHEAETSMHLGLYRKNDQSNMEIVVSRDVLKYILSGKSPHDYLVTIKRNEKGEQADNTDGQGNFIEEFELTRVVMEWYSKGYLLSASTSGGKLYYERKVTVFSGKGQERCYIIKIKGRTTQ